MRRQIIRHPIQVEVLKDGFLDIFFFAVDYFSNDGIGIEESTVLHKHGALQREEQIFVSLITICERVIQMKMKER